MDRAQVFSLDVMFAIGVFALILMSIAWSWSFVTEKISQDNIMTDMQINSKNAISVLLETPGRPTNWDNTAENDLFDNDVKNVDSLGLSVSYPSVLHKNKVARLDYLNNSYYENIRDVLGLSKYEFHLNFYVYDGSTYPSTPNYEIGNGSSSQSKYAFVINRYAVIDNNWTKVVFKLWQ